MILARFWEWWATREDKKWWSPRWQGHRTTPKRKTKQKPIKLKEKGKAKKPGCYKPCPLKEISSSRFGCSGNKYDLRTPFPTRVSFFLCLLFPQEFRWSTYLALGWFASPFPNSDGFVLTCQIFLLTWIFSYLRWYPMDLSIDFLLVMKTFLLLPWGCFK